MLNKSGAFTQPWRSPLFTPNRSETSLTALALPRAGVELAHKIYHLGGDAVWCQNLAEERAINRVIHLLEVDKAHLHQSAVDRGVGNQTALSFWEGLSARSKH